jgi:hypothetical protein
MAKDRLSMRKFKEVLRLKYDHQLTNRKIAKSCAMSHVTVGKYLTWPKRPGSPGRCPTISMTGSSNSAFTRKSSGLLPTNRPCRHGVPVQGTQKEARHLAAAVVRIQAGQSGRLPVQLFLRTVSKWRKGLDISLRQEHLAGEKAVYRLCRTDGSHHLIRKPERSILRPRFLSPPWVPATTATPKPPHPRRCPTGSNPTSAPWSSSAASPDPGSRQSEKRGHPSLPLRTGRQSHLPGSGPALWHHGHSRPARKTQRQGQGGKSSVLIVERWILAALRNHRFFSWQN